MDSSRLSRVQALYLEAEGLPAEARTEFLNEVCGGDAALRVEVETLLRGDAETRAAPVNESPTLAGEPRDPTLPAGTLLGAWRITRLIGRGGMGEVYEAQRADGTFELCAALKMLKRGLDTAEVVARFNRERRILARLDHPNIAHVLDAGVAPDGRPFLVMEYVEGKSITEYARDRNLSIPDLLRLMATICEAVQAAHAKKIVHRDLKPSNVLVTSQDQVKLLDFGIAKALAEQDDSELTRLGEFTSLTPAYAAPEQLLGRLATPATDVYALGCILYQLLLERLPHSRAGRSVREIGRGLDQETVERPSTVLRRERGRMPDKVRTARLRAISGDLDQVVLKALHPAPERRYADAQGLADDLLRVLQLRPVLARPDSLSYRGSRFVRRHAVGVSVAALIAAIVAAGVIGTAYQAHAARVAERAERAQRDLLAGREAELRQMVEFQAGLLKRVDVQDMGSGWVRRMRDKIAAHLAADKSLLPRQADQLLAAFDRMQLWSQPSEVARQTLGAYVLAPAEREVAARFRAHPDSEASLRLSIGEAYSSLGLYADSRGQFEQSVALRRRVYGNDAPQTLDAMLHLAQAQKESSDLKGAIASASSVYEVRRRTLGQDDPDTLRAATVLGTCYYEVSDVAAALAILQPLVPRVRRILGPEDPDTLVAMLQLGNTLSLKGDLVGAGRLFRQVYEARVRVLGPDAFATLGALQMVGNNEANLEHFAEARPLLEKLLEARRRTLGDDHPYTLEAISDLADVLDNLGERRRALDLLREDYFALRKRLGDDALPVSIAATNYALSLRDCGDTDDARVLMDQVVALRTRLLGADNPRTLYAMNNLGRVLREQHHLDAALRLERRTLEAQRRAPGPDSPQTLETWHMLAVTLTAAGRAAEAAKEFRAMLAPFEQVVGANDGETLILHNDLALALNATGDSEAARAMQEQALAREKALLPEGNWYVLRTTAGLAQTLHSLHRDAQAEPLARAALQGMLAQFSLAAHDARDAATTLAAILDSRGRHAEARTLRTRLAAARPPRGMLLAEAPGPAQN
jgi:serine/threonine protein kinase/tetratricopeptide (TPR) repeat protein